jgi:hypothetical protein
MKRTRIRRLHPKRHHFGAAILSEFVPGRATVDLDGEFGGERVIGG